MPLQFRAAAWVKFLTDNPIGLYIHIPFCTKKCAYCDFYSACVTNELTEEYVKGLCESFKNWDDKICRPIDTVYFGGGTPSLLGNRIVPLLRAARSSFCITDNAEITAELNPAGNSAEFLYACKCAGVNRLSIGAQSGSDDELLLLGRTHTAKDTAETVKAARDMGFKNISLDLMCGLPGSNKESLKKSLDFTVGLEPEHISVYILKIEENTLFYKNKATLTLPDDDETAEQYMYICEYLESKGYLHYEISNFCRPGYESRHNLKYWNCDEYLGIGAAAHSFIDGKRFFYPRSIKAFLNGEPPVPDGDGGDAAEYIMLRLRLSRGVDFAEYRRRFGSDLSDSFIKAAERLKSIGLVKITENAVAITDRGMPVSNSIITELLENI